MIDIIKSYYIYEFWKENKKKAKEEKKVEWMKKLIRNVNDEIKIKSFYVGSQELFIYLFDIVLHNIFFISHVYQSL